MRVRLAAVDRPESDGYLLVQINKPGGDKVLVEVRDNAGWDREFATPGVMVRRAPNPADKNEITYVATGGRGRCTARVRRSISGASRSPSRSSGPTSARQR